MSRYVSFLLPQGIPTGGYTPADFLSRHNLAQWIPLLDRRMLKPILDPSQASIQVMPVLGIVIEAMAHIM